jgi:hypothetical protein
VAESPQVWVAHALQKSVCISVGNGCERRKVNLVLVSFVVLQSDLSSMTVRRKVKTSGSLYGTQPVPRSAI